MRISTRDIPGPWRRDGSRWASGRSWIEPYDHPHLVTDYCDGVLTVQEPGGDSVTVVLNLDSVTVTAGRQGTAPVYLAQERGTLHGSWDMAELHPHVRGLIDREVARLLGIRFRYGHQTVFQGVHRLSERSVARFDHEGLSLHYPTAAEHHRARQIRAGADVVAAYDRLLARVVQRPAYDPYRTCVELSGGLDSSNVAATLGNLHPGQIASSALLILGEPGAQQSRRRNVLSRLFNLGEDVTVDFAGRLPFDPGGRRARGVPVTPYEDAYDEAKGHLVEQLRERDIRTVFTGIGGDEMVARTAAEFPHVPHGVNLIPKPWIGARTIEALDESEEGIAPAAVVNEMTLIASACAAPVFLRAGIWPVHPYADPELIAFGECLPVEWRRYKRLHRERLNHLGCVGEVLRPPLTENFAEVMRESIRRHGLGHLTTMLTEGSPLIEQGFIDADGLATTRDRLAAGRFEDRDTELYAAIAVDLAVRAFC